MFRRFLAAMALALLPALLQAATVEATLNRSSMQLGEAVTLNLRVTGDTGGVAAPDLSALTADFEVLGSSQNRSMNFSNGVRTSSLVFGIALRPRHAGQLQVPALTVAGVQTAPLPLQVGEPDPQQLAMAHKSVFMEAQIEPAHAWVGQQLSYVMRLYYAIGIADGALGAPQVDGVEVSQIGRDLNYDAERNGHNYRVLERRYALVPQRAGHLTIPGPMFQGEAIDARDPGSFFGATTPVSAAAPTRTLEVQPAGTSATAWLPARELTLALEGWPAAGQEVRVGQPLNLTMSVQATGLLSEALPALSLPPLDGATVYPDKPATGQRIDGLWVVAWRRQAFAVMPERAGPLTIPATRLTWWNVLTQREVVAQIPAHTITVLPAVGAPASTPVDGAVAVQSAPSGEPPIVWRWLALGSLGLWLVSVLAWWLWRRWRRDRPAVVAAAVAAPVSVRQCRQAFIAAARGSDVAEQARSLLAWARAERPGIPSLGELAAALADASQRAAIDTLQHHRYAHAPGVAATGSLADVFKRGFVWRADRTDADDSGLPPLYPFKLH